MRLRWSVAIAIAMSLLAGACTHAPRTTLRVQSPGDCTPVDVSASPETAWLLAQTAQQFNTSAAAHPSTGGCTFVRVESLDAAAALHELVAGWPDTRHARAPPPSRGCRRRARGARC